MGAPADLTNADFAFKPQVSGGTDGWDASVTVAGITGGATGGNLPARNAGYNMLQIANPSASWGYVNAGDANVVAATVAAGYPVAPGAVVVLAIEPWMTRVSVIMGTANGNMVFTLGQGM